MPKLLMDRYGRMHDYLRISVTDRCNLRCVYCMPEEGMEFEPDDKLLTFEEITEVVRVLAGLGVRKLRLTVENHLYVKPGTIDWHALPNTWDSRYRVDNEWDLFCFES